ncbi:conjugal transfer protein TraI [Thalassospira profundimaris]|uniref:Conjugal transfer protein TraI n=1 Tax=Thalassospira profundimaris TaxID=502049 RepID=A0A367WGF0_9PROT|nr:relaxase/mobilization nuclease RlxS [Thalassospira profundimaris]RCK40514.1 conjugal transfer protein TraI [Thalassospira profundimaris]
MADDVFKPKLGKIRSRGGKGGRKFLHRVLAATNRAGGFRRLGRSRFTGSRLGRASGAGQVLASRDHYAAFRQRLVIIKSRIVRLTGKGMQGARAHLRYIQRDGVTREGLPGELYSADQDRADGKAFLERADGDRHQFRFIVSAEDGAEYADLKPVTRRLMRQMEIDLGTTLDWVAVDHFNTGHPHSHILVRGKDDQERDLVIARNYMARGMRERAAEIVSLDLGPRTDLEIENRLRREIDQDRLTSIDRNLLRQIGEDRIVSAADKDAFRQSLRAGRLQKLRRLGLAEEIIPGQWRLEQGLEATLSRMGERDDIIKTLHREMKRREITRSPADFVINSVHEPDKQPIIGRVVTRGLSDELNDRHYLIVDGVDGKTRYVEIGKGEATELVPEDSIVHISPRNVQPRKVDRTVAEIAWENDGRYSIDVHLEHDPTATEEYAQAHVRRLEAMRRLTQGVEREPDGTWIITPDHLEKAVEYERERGKSSPVIIRQLSHLSLGQQLESDGATWLDRELVGSDPVHVRDAGFGREVRDAQARRRQWLIAQGLARQEQDRIIYRSDMIDTLQKRELARMARQLSKELGLHYVETGSGERVEGTLRRSVELASRKYALIEKSQEFTLVPWRPVLARQLGKQVSGIMCDGNTISWAIGRQRGGPSVS